MHADYTREVNHCYMNFQSTDSFDEDSYELKMIFSNRISPLLPMTISHIDSSVICQYDISSLQPLPVFCGSHKIHAAELTKLIENLLDALSVMEDYLLSENHLFLDPEYLYLKWPTLEFRIAYIPFYSCDLKTSLQNLMQYLLTCLGNEDQDTVVLAYRIYHELKEPNMQIGNIRKLLISKDPDETDSESVSSYTNTDRYNDPHTDSVSTTAAGSEISREIFSGQKKDSRLKKVLPDPDTWKTALLGVPAAVFIYAVFHFYMIGYLSPLKAAVAVLLTIAALILLLWLIKKRRNSDPIQESATPFASSASFSETPEDRISETSLFDPFPENEKTVLLNREESDITNPFSVKRLVPEQKEHHAGLSVLELDRDNLLIGFQKGICDKVIPDPTVSRIHARIVKRDNAFFLTDLSSGNGTSADEKPLSPMEEVRLQKGMRIKFGAAEFTVE